MRRLMIDCSDAGTGEGALTPNIWQISYPYSNQGGQVIPIYYYWHPQCFSPSGITEVVFINCSECQNKNNLCTQHVLSMF